MLFQFAPAIEAGIETGKYLKVFTNGIPIGMARDAVTGQFVAHAIGATFNNSPLSPLVVASNLLTSGVQTYQINQGFTSVLNGLQTLQTSLGVLQATTALIGVGTVTGAALMAVNLYQTLKLRQEVEQMRLDVKNGFIDLKQALKDQGAEIRQLIEQLSQDIKFEQHRTVLIRAYGLFIQAMNRFRSAMQLQEISRRNAEIDGVRGMLFEALADYTNPHLLSETCAAGQLRRLECAWAIEQAIVVTYQIQNEVLAASERLYQLQEKISDDALTVIHHCESDDELDFLFPEITRIHNHDLVLLNSWHNHLTWIQSLPPSDLKLLSSADFKISEISFSSEVNQTTSALVVPEQLIYEELVDKSHFYSLRDQLLFMFEPELRHEYESYIEQEAKNYAYKKLCLSNLQESSDLTVANLYYYFKIRDKSETIDNSQEEDLGICTKLCHLLANGNWQEADNETAKIIFQLSQQNYQISSEYATKVSADDFRIIDKLWLKYSNGHFGFSVQRRIWLEKSDKLGEFDSNKIYAHFCHAVGWRVINGCLLSSYLNFSLNAPSGHLPVAVAGQGYSAATFLNSLIKKFDR